MSEVIRGLLRHHGVCGLFRGFGPTLLRSTMGNAAAFGTFETLQAANWPSWASGGAAGLMFWTVGFPADVIKSRMQTGKGSWLTKEAGLQGLLQGHFRGYSAVMLRAFPTNAVAFAAFGWCERKLKPTQMPS